MRADHSIFAPASSIGGGAGPTMPTPHQTTVHRRPGPCATELWGGSQVMVSITPLARGSGRWGCGCQVGTGTATLRVGSLVVSGILLRRTPIARRRSGVSDIHSQEERPATKNGVTRKNRAVVGGLPSWRNCFSLPYCRLDDCFGEDRLSLSNGKCRSFCSAFGAPAPRTHKID